MIPTKCIVRHDPEAGQYGDCVRACVAAVLDLSTADVPHFFHDGCDGPTGFDRMRQWLRQRNMSPVWSVFSGDISRDNLLTAWGEMNPETPCILFGNTGSGEHAVVISGDKVVSNPAWYGGQIVRASDNSFWTVLIIAVGVA